MKTYADDILEQVKNCRHNDSYFGECDRPKWQNIYRDYEELANRLKIACEFLRKDYAYKDKWNNEARELADKLEAMPEVKE